MAASLMNRVISRTETFGAFRVSLNLLRNFSAPAASPSSDPIKPKGRKKKKKKKNLIEVAQFLPNWGIGYHMAKAHWNGVSYEITKINLYKDGRHGKAWGNGVFNLSLSRRRMIAKTRIRIPEGD